MFGDRYCITCAFIEGATIPGCYADFVRDNHTTIAHDLFIPLVTGSNCIDSGLPSGNYSIYIYDDEDRSGVVTVLNVAVTPSLSTTTTTVLPSMLYYTNCLPYHNCLVSLYSASVSVLVTSNTIIITDSLITTPPQYSLIIAVSSAAGGVAILLFLCVMVPLVACLVKYKKKNSQLKIGIGCVQIFVYSLSLSPSAEVDARERQRSAEHVLYSITGIATPTTSANHRLNSVSDYRSPDTSGDTSGDSAYEMIDNSQTVLMQSCPAYQPLPLVCTNPLSLNNDRVLYANTTTDVH